MRRLTLEIVVAGALTLAAIVSLASGANASDVMVSGAYARASAVSTAKAGSVYLTVMNHGAVADRLVSVRTDVAASASLHETITGNGITSMRDVEALDLSPGTMRELKPNGMHVMLTGLKAPLKEGETFRMTLFFEKAGEVLIDVPVGGVAASADEHGAHTQSSAN